MLKVLLVRSQKEIKEHVTGNHRKGDLCCRDAENRTEFCSTVECLAEEISKQSVEDACWLLATYSKMQQK
jgi:hypothetical protein